MGVIIDSKKIYFWVVKVFFNDYLVIGFEILFGMSESFGVIVCDDDFFVFG